MMKLEEEELDERWFDGFDDRSNLTNHTEANLVCWFQVINSTIDKFIKFIVLNLLYAFKFIVPL